MLIIKSKRKYISCSPAPNGTTTFVISPPGKEGNGVLLTGAAGAVAGWWCGIISHEALQYHDHDDGDDVYVWRSVVA